MKSIRKFSLLALALAGGLFAAASPARADAPQIESAIAVDGQTQPNSVFAPTTAKLNAFFRSTGTTKGDKLRGVWIAEDVGTAAPANTKIDESTLTADEDNFYGAFELSKPTAGWPVGKYRVEIYLNDQLSTTVKFVIQDDAAK